MQGQVRSSALSRLPIAVLTTLLTILGLVGFSLAGAGSTPAHAHDQLVSSNPKDGAKLDKQPEWLELNFSGDIQEIGTEIQVKNKDGKDVSAGEIMVDGRKVTSALPDDLAAGEYTVVWRVVSQDGHPISDELTFTITDNGGAGGSFKAADEKGDGAATDEAAASETGAGLGGKEIDPDEAKQTINDDEGTSPAMIIALVIGGLAAVGIVFALLVRRSKGFGNE